MKTLGFGEILYDRIEGEDYFGGAPVNVSVHLSRMGADSYIISSLGNDDKGKEAEIILRSENVKTDFLQLNSIYPTGIVEVTMEDGFPSYDIKKGSAWDYIHLTDKQMNKLFDIEWDLIYCGSLAQRTSSNRELLRKIIPYLKYRHFFFDVNLRQDYFSENVIRNTIAQATILKMNDEELPVISELLFGEKLSIQAFFKEISSVYNLELLVLTMGASGATIFNEEDINNPLFFPAEKVEVVDTVGAGDSFSGAFVYSYLNGENLEIAGKKAAKLASFITGQSGALPAY